MTNGNGTELQVSRGFLTPTTIKEGMELAGWIAESDLAPKDYKGKPQNVLIAIQMGMEVGLSPMQSIQNIAVINGRPAMWGDAMLAICQAHRDFESIDENESDDKKGVCVVKRKGMSAQRREFSVADAQRAGLWGKQGSWQTVPARMLKLRARAFALRDTFADALRGLQSAEEQTDIPIETTTIPAPKVSNPPAMPQRASETVPAAPAEPTAAAPVTASGKTPTQAQLKRFFAICNEAGKTEAQIKEFLAGLGVVKSWDMKIEDYDKACEWAKTPMETPGVGE